MKVERYRPGRRASPHNPEATGLPPHGTHSKSLCKSSSVSSYGDVKRVSRQDQVALASYPLDLPDVGPLPERKEVRSHSQNKTHMPKREMQCDGLKARQQSKPCSTWLRPPCGIGGFAIFSFVDIGSCGWLWSFSISFTHWWCSLELWPSDTCDDLVILYSGVLFARY